MRKKTRLRGLGQTAEGRFNWALKAVGRIRWTGQGVSCGSERGDLSCISFFLFVQRSWTLPQEVCLFLSLSIPPPFIFPFFSYLSFFFHAPFTLPPIHPSSQPASQSLFRPSVHSSCHPSIHPNMYPSTYSSIHPPCLSFISPSI